MRDVYAEAEAKIRALLLARPQARGRGKSPEFIDKAAAVAVWILRRHGPYGGRIFSACREVLRKVFGRCCRAVIEALRQVGLLRFLPRANGHERKWRSPEYAAFQFEVGPDFALLFLAAQTPIPVRLQRGLEEEDSKRGRAVSGMFVPARTWDCARPEFRLPSRATLRRAATASLEALQRLPLPRLSPSALATFTRP